MGSGDCRAIDATTELESIPPLRKAPSGTSAIMRMRTASSNFSRTRSDGLGVSQSRRGFGRRRRHLPVAALLHRAPLVSEPAARRNPPDGPIGGQRIRNVIELEVQAERFRGRSPAEPPPGAGRKFHCRNRCRWGARRSTAASCRSGRAPAADGPARASQMAKANMPRSRLRPSTPSCS